MSRTSIYILLTAVLLFLVMISNQLSRIERILRNNETKSSYKVQYEKDM